MTVATLYKLTVVACIRLIGIVLALCGCAVSVRVDCHVCSRATVVYSSLRTNYI